MTDSFEPTHDSRHRVRTTEYQAYHDWRSNQSISVTLLEALDDVPDVDPMTSEPIGRLIDVEAIEQLFSGGDVTRLDGRATVEFTYEGHDVTIGSDGRITIADERRT